MAALLLASFGLIGASAQADITPVLKDQDWALYDYSTTEKPGPCIASVGTKIRDTYYRLDISRLRNSDQPTEVLLTQVGKGKGPVKGWLAAIEDSEVKLAMPLLQQANGSDVFWQVPRNTQLLLNAFKSKKELKIYAMGVPDDKQVRLVLSAKGSQKILTEFQNRCAASSQADNADFEKSFLNDVQFIADPLKISSPQAASLRSTFLRAAQASVALGRNNQAVEDLRKKFSSQLAEKESLTVDLQKLEVTLQDLNSQYASNEDLRARSITELADVKQKIPALESSTAASEVVLHQAEAVIAPYLDEHNRLDSQVYNAASRLNAWEERLSQIDKRSAELESNIADLETRRDQALAAASRAQNELYGARQTLDRAQREYNSFDTFRETENRLRNDWRYQQIRRDLPDEERKLGDAEREGQELTRQRIQIEAALSQCQATPGSDCSSHTAALNQINSMISDANSRASSARNNVDRMRSDRERIERQVRREVDSDRDDLLRRYERAQNEVRDLESTRDRNNDIARDISLRLLPNAQSELNALNSERPSVVSEIANARSDLSDRKEARAKYEQQVNWAPKAAELERAQRDHYAKASALQSAVNRKETLETTISESLRTKASLEASIASTRSTIEQRQTRLAQVNQDLQPYVVERARLDGIGGDIAGQIAKMKSEFTASVPK